jgi:DNA-binding GntR family transcriptional regulator
MDIREILEIREIIETGAAKHAARFHSHDGTLQAKKAEHEKLLREERDSEEYVHEWGEWEDVHLAIVKALGNQRFLEMYQGLLARIKRIRNHFGGSFTQRRFQEIISEHLVILDAILDGDQDRAEDAVMNHLKNATAFLTRLSVSPRRE